MQSDWLTQPDSQVIVTDTPVTITFLKMAAYRIAIMNNDIGKFVYDSMRLVTCLYSKKLALSLAKLKFTAIYKQRCKLQINRACNHLAFGY